MAENTRSQWASKLGFILAAAGSAIGLGNIWKFPGKAYDGGGSAYLIIYLIIVVLIGLPVMITELSLGRKTQKNTIGMFRSLNKKFSWVGWSGVICTFIILCYYSHVGGWVLSYVFTYAGDSGVAKVDVLENGLDYFYKFLGYNAATGATNFPTRAILFAGIFVLVNAIILLKGVEGGIEKFNKVGMPALFVILLILLVRSVSLPGAGAGLAYMLKPDFSKVSAYTLLSALGQAFFSLSLGMAIMTTYGSYLSKEENIAKNSLMICGLDTLVAFLAGFIIVPAVFATLGAQGVGKGGGFAFASLAGVFKAMPGGAFFGVLFYLLLLFAALSSSISIEEGIVAYVTEEWHWSRKRAIITISSVCFLIGIIYTISQASVTIKLPWFDFKNGVTFPAAGDWMEYLTDRVMLPICAFGECIFAGWVILPSAIKDEVESSGHKWSWFGIFKVCIKYLCPIAIAIILIYSLVAGTTIS